MAAVFATISPKIDLAEALTERARRKSVRKLATYYPEIGPYRRELYPKHMKFFASGLTEKVRAAIAANRTGKTEGIGGYELTLHLTGNYPAFWIGKRFNKPISAWAAGDTGKTVRDILQSKLIGSTDAIGTGLIPGDLILECLNKAGVADAIELVKIRHASGGISKLAFKSYDQGRKSFQGSEQHVILLDEEPPLDVYTECAMRTMATGNFTGGIIMATFTPLKGMTKLIKHMRESGVCEISITWDDVPHLSADDKAEMLKDIPEFMRDPRTKGVPMTGFGLIFDVPEASIIVDPFDVPTHWPQLGGLDFGSDHPTAASKLVFDRDNDCVYVAACKKARKTMPDHFALMVKPWGAWLPFAWPHDGHQDGVKFNRDDTKQLHEIYKAAGMNMLKDHAQFSSGSISVEAGIMEMRQRMQDGRWKVFSNCADWREEYRGYQRNEDGSIRKENDDVLCSSRYGYMSRRFAKTRPVQIVRTAPSRQTIGDRKIGY